MRESLILGEKGTFARKAASVITSRRSRPRIDSRSAAGFETRGLSCRSTAYRMDQGLPSPVTFISLSSFPSLSGCKLGGVFLHRFARSPSRSTMKTLSKTLEAK
jgi:hypothetical protein